MRGLAAREACRLLTISALSWPPTPTVRLVCLCLVQIEDTHTMSECRNTFMSNGGYCQTPMDIASLAAEAFFGLHRLFFAKRQGRNWRKGLGLPNGRLADWALHVSEMHA
jgi:hypothetical protein